MKRGFRTLLQTAFPLLFLSACAAGSVLHVPGDLTRPQGDGRPAAGTPQGYSPPQAAVIDFEFAGEPDGTIGRDYDRARPIVWKGSPGKAMADLVAGALGENRVPAVRVAADAPPADSVPVRITGKVRRFEANARRTKGVNVLIEATVSVTIAVEAPGLSGPAEHTVTSSTSLADMFVTPDDLHEALMSAANAVAEEAVRKLLEARTVSPAS